MTFNEFKLYCIWFVQKYNGMYVKDVLKDCSPINENEKLLINNITFVRELNVYFMLSKPGYTILRFTNRFEYQSSIYYTLKKYNRETFEDII